MCTVVSGEPKGLFARLNLSKILSILFIIISAIYLFTYYPPQQGALLIVGVALGLTLYHSAFSFTSAWRVFILNGKGYGLRAQMIMLCVAVLLFFPTLGIGDFFGNPVKGSIAPLSVSIIFGAFIFGIGMQLGGGCASGVLFTAGGGNVRMLVVLLFFIIGTLISTAHSTFWANVPSLPPISLIDSFGVVTGIIISLTLFLFIITLTIVIEKNRHGSLEKTKKTSHHGFQRFFKGPWPLIWGGVALAVLNYITLIISGKPWSIAGAFPIWGAKISYYLGLDVSSWPFWQAANNAKNLNSSVFSNITSVMDFGIIAGAILAASLAGRFAFKLSMPFRSFIAAILGGLLLGYGARIAYGCNIGAYFSGLASGSLHGWLWLISAFLGNILGVKLRPLFFPNSDKNTQLTSC